MLCPGRDQDGYPLEGVDEYPSQPHWDEIIPRFVKLLQDANRREEAAR